tara:strand:+ start:5885 stop:6460 length:576 start_codon:yes stop_codon:yes gene_type:complete
MKTKELIFIKKALNDFGKRVILRSRINAKGKNIAKKLKKRIKQTPSEVQLSFLMPEYGIYYDKGVKGKNPMDLPKGAKQYGKQRGRRSPFKFGSGKSKGKGTLRGAIDKYVLRNKNFLTQTRDDKGQFIKRKSLVFLISRSIYLSGLKPSLFFTKPFESEFRKLPKKLSKAFALTIKNFLKVKYPIKNIIK